MSEDKVPYGDESEKWMQDAQELRGLLESAGLTQVAAAQELDVSERQLREQCSGRVPVPRAVLYAMHWIAERKPNQERWIQVHWKKLGMAVSKTDRFESEFDGRVLRVKHNNVEALFGDLEYLEQSGYISLHSSYSSDRFRLALPAQKPTEFQRTVNIDMPRR